MIEVQKEVDLQEANTLGIQCIASHYCEFDGLQDLDEIIQFSKDELLPIRLLGEGSNIVLPSRLDALVVKSKICHIALSSEDDVHVHLKVGGGLVWHTFVEWCVENGFSGIENLAYIPGTVGAAPVQNIGAYGVEVSDRLDSVYVYDLLENGYKYLSVEQCEFAYRSSIFKKHENRYVIVELNFRLSKSFSPDFSYGALASLSDKKQVSLKDVFEEIVAIRRSKLPEPKEIPNAGSFFKNPVVSESKFNDLKKMHPHVIGFPDTNGVKLAAGWLIEQAGLKGKSSVAGVGCYKNQALVLINLNRASANEVLGWAEYVSNQVFQKFSVALEIEPRTW